MRLVGTLFGCVSWLLIWISFQKREGKLKEFLLTFYVVWLAQLSLVSTELDLIAQEEHLYQSCTHFIWFVRYRGTQHRSCIISSVSVPVVVFVSCRPGKIPPQLIVFQLIHINKLTTCLSIVLFSSCLALPVLLRRSHTSRPPSSWGWCFA